MIIHISLLDGNVIDFYTGGQNPACENCESLFEVTFAPDPYSQEINGDNTDHWLCSTCRQSSADDI